MTIDYEEEKKAIYERFLTFIRELPLLSPKEIFDTFGEYGYIGQVEAKKSLSLMAYRHLKRIKDLYLDLINPQEIPKKNNYLLVGPTGCGKTFMVEVLFKKILKIPTVIVDITNYSETGYIGQDIPTILTRLLHAAEYNIFKASIGIVCLDEFDKISSGGNNAVFSGAGTTKDVTGIGVQRELLKLLENTELVVPLEFGHSTFGERILMSTRDISFIGCGAFSGLKGLIHERDSKYNIGFGKNSNSKKEEIAVTYNQKELEDISNFQAYGFIPELIARFTRIVPYHPLSKNELTKILKDNVIVQYEKEFKRHNIELRITPKVLEKIIDESIKRQTGARGIESILVRYIEDAAFDAYSQTNVKQVKIKVYRDNIKCEIIT